MVLEPPIEGESTFGIPPEGGFATIESVEPENPDPDRDWLLRLDVVDQNAWVNRPIGAPADQIRSALKTYILETEAAQTRDIFRDLIAYAGEKLEGAERRRWWRLQFEQKRTRPQVQLFPNLFSDPFRLKLTLVDDVDDETSRELDQTCGMDDLSDASEEELRDALAPAAFETRHIGVLDVGQGSANALLDPDGSPLAYYDVGGGVTTNRRTWPRDFVGLCFTQNPVVILSHWDLDHWAAHSRGLPFSRRGDEAYRKHHVDRPPQPAARPHQSFPSEVSRSVAKSPGEGPGLAGQLAGPVDRSTPSIPMRRFLPKRLRPGPLRILR